MPAYSRSLSFSVTMETVVARWVVASSWWAGGGQRSKAIRAGVGCSGMPIPIATGVPMAVEAPMYADGVASGIPAGSVGGPELSEFDAARVARSATSPGLKPAARSSTHPTAKAKSPCRRGATKA
jgi:hypothetical protein